MRDSEKQDEFLKHGRFGDGEESLAAKTDPVFVTGLLLLLIALPALLMGNVLFLMVFAAAVPLGGVLCIWGIVRTHLANRQKTSTFR